jgi:hypothetical protein
VAFEQLTAGMALETMHEDLGLAIEEEGDGGVYWYATLKGNVIY